jgi:hypothetical protein
LQAGEPSSSSELPAQAKASIFNLYSRPKSQEKAAAHP